MRTLKSLLPNRWKEGLKNVYRRLPVIQELCEISTAVGSIEQHVQKITTNELESFVRGQLLPLPRYGEPKRLHRSEFQSFSQNGEDGAIAEIFRRIGSTTGYFVEIGSGNGLENNSAFLLAQGWRGCWLEGSDTSCNQIRTCILPHIRGNRLNLLQTMVTAENIQSLFQKLEVPKEFDLLSIDIDLNDYWVWAALTEYRPKVVVIEYNGTFPPGVDWKVKYCGDSAWDGTSYFGASLKAYELLGRKLGYSLVGCELSGVNAFFVRNDLCADHFASPFTAENHYEPPRYWLVRRQGHPRSLRDF